MNRYIYDDITIGHTEVFTVTITNEMMLKFYYLTGDSNPLHTNEAFAKASRNGYAGKVVYGLLTASFLSTLAGEYLPGENSLIHKIEAEFPAPVYIGDRLNFKGEVIRKDDKFKIIEIKVTAKNGEDKKVLRGKMLVEVLH